MSKIVSNSSCIDNTFFRNTSINVPLQQTRRFKTVDLCTPAVRTDYELQIDSFVYSDYPYRIDPPLSFKYCKNYELDQFEISGRGIYDDIFAYGETLKEALEMLTEAILPTFWGECLTFTITDKSHKLAKIALDLKERVISTEDKGLLNNGSSETKEN